MGRISSCSLPCFLLMFVATLTYCQDYKRAKSIKPMMAFPRVGRSGTMPYSEHAWDAQKRTGSSNMNNNGLWFGPRLGRIHKRADYKPDLPFAYLYFGDYTPRLGRESEELFEDEVAEQDNDKAEA